ncbi:uncharacterized protein N7482_000062 [Penicillium canariense]|uniref:Uncharacterized protein n=1 Tax=Penicillium canariense TaxID=189055 RepID=A0A9W9LSA7_9EURO|nr:uncharacterized protein N7482_000062 [Penicillium canariense]KAJ5174185.1 hypothetical protein N7482_000062 [Penicillium canariense]
MDPQWRRRDMADVESAPAGDTADHFLPPVVVIARHFRRPGRHTAMIRSWPPPSDAETLRLRSACGWPSRAIKDGGPASIAHPWYTLYSVHTHMGEEIGDMGILLSIEMRPLPFNGRSMDDLGQSPVASRQHRSLPAACVAGAGETVASPACLRTRIHLCGVAKAPDDERQLQMPLRASTAFIALH